MTGEEMAEEYAEYEQCAHCINPQHCQGKEDCYDFNEVKCHFLAGLKAGRPKWHNLRKDPTDIPPRKDDVYSIEVWAKDAKGNYGKAMFSYACFEDDGKYNHWSGAIPILWTELPKHIEEEEE